ncbi:MAG: thymidylate synthase [Actinobacteria bacterium]|nr:thymidylate synthase [Actinomycetota bacterium]
MNNADKAYLALCEDILTNGVAKEDRTGTGTLSVFGRQLRFDLAEGFPLLTTKRVPFRLILQELLFFVKGKTNLKDLLDADVDIWTRDGYAKAKREFGEDFIEDTFTLDEFRERAATSGFDLGPIYGSQWRSWTKQETGAGYGYEKSIDQLQNAIDEIKRNPDSRRMIVSAWNPAELDDMALPPCHIMFQLYVADGKLSLQMYQRSADVFLGLPFNIASYATLLEMIALECGLDCGELIITIGDAHIYTNHIAQVETQMFREPKDLPKLNIIQPRGGGIDSYEADCFYLSGYEPHGRLRGEQSF